MDAQGFNCRNATAVQDFQIVKEFSYFVMIITVLNAY